MSVIRGPWRDRSGHDDANAAKWRGDLHLDDATPPLMWKDGDHYELLPMPKSVTFPICTLCGHVVWEWPHYEEEVPDNAICERCFKEEESAA